jgi:hypothetical protein
MQFRKNNPNISWIQWEYRRLDGTEMAQNQQVRYYFSKENEYES